MPQLIILSPEIRVKKTSKRVTLPPIEYVQPIGNNRYINVSQRPIREIQREPLYNVRDRQDDVLPLSPPNLTQYLEPLQPEVIVPPPPPPIIKYNLTLENLTIHNLQNQLSYYISESKLAFGIDVDEMDSCVSQKEKSKWEWVACVQMVMKLYGIDIKQKDIAFSTYGIVNWFAVQSINRTAGDKEIAESIDKIAEKAKYTSSVIREKFDNTSLPKIKKLVGLVINELKDDRPVMISYTNPKLGVKKLALITGIVTNADGSKISKLFIRNPSKSKDGGKVTYEDTDLVNFLDSIKTVFFIDLQKPRRRKRRK
ncbi:MAG: hypothetical protein RLZZ210_184 [Pseudomonadota bacterium]|jgi:hypothetical protein